MTRVKIKRVDNTVEEKILTGMIVSTEFCRDILPMLNLRYFQAPYVSRVAGWVVSYYKKYEAAPERIIEDIFETKKGKMNPSEVEVIGTFLQSLSEEYERQDVFNVQYYLDSAEKYFKERAVAMLSSDVSVLVSSGDIAGAEEVIRGFTKVAKAISSWKNPFDDAFIDRVFSPAIADGIFSFDGEVGKLLGVFKRGWLVSVMAPEKRGKTFFLMEVAIQALLSRLKVVFISLEMFDEDIGERIYRRVTGEGDEVGDITFPCFDCYKNQDGSCDKRERVNRIKLLDEDGEQPEFDMKMEYSVCTCCREKKGRDYVPATWFTSYRKEKISAVKTKRKVKALKKMYGDNFRLISYPVRQANISRIKRDLEILEYTEGFLFDVLVLDYADILGPEDERLVGRDAVNETWMMLKSLAQEKFGVVVTGSQTTAVSADKKNVTSKDTAEDKRKKAHVDLSIYFSQTSEEKRRWILRLSIFHRHKNFDEYKQVQILQQLDLGQVLLDSEKVSYKRKEE